MTATVTFAGAIVIDGNFVVVIGTLDDADDDVAHTRIFQASLEDRPTWWAHDIGWRAITLAHFISQSDDIDDVVVVSEEGDLHYVGDHEPRFEKIPGAGLYSEDAVGWGYMEDVRQIGEHLYACGGAGQVYKRLGPDRWAHIDEGLLQDAGVSERILPVAIDGPTEDAIYLAGYFSSVGYPPRLDFWNSAHWREIALPSSAERITDICVESASRIWLCGANGTLLLGNADDGFVDLSTPADNQLFSSLCLYRGVVFLASNVGLYAYDPNDHAGGIRQVTTGLSPELEDTSTIASVDDTLWSIGAKDIVRYDGTAWQRIDHPDNPPVGASGTAP
jgi:hypothetical protein